MGTTATDSSSSDSEGPIVKKRKTKPSPSKQAAEEEKLEPEEPKRPVDFRNDLLAEWEISDDELDDTISEIMKDQTMEKKSTPLERTTDNESSLLDRSMDAETKPEKTDESNVETIVLDDSELPARETEEVIELIEDEDPLPAKEKKRKSPRPKMDKETQEAIKSCFDFDEDEEDEHAIINTTTIVGRKIPRVIPPTERRKSDISDDVVIVQDKELAVKSSEKDGEELLTNEDIDNAFKELMQATEVPELPRVHSTLKCEQNFHSVKTIKFPDKPENPTEFRQIDNSPVDTETPRNDSEEVPSKPDTTKEPSSKIAEKADQEIATKLTNPKKRFVKCFEDFELMQNELRRKEEQQNEETKRKEEEKTHLETTEDRLKEQAKSVHIGTVQASTKPDQNVEKELETIFGSLSKTPDFDEDDSVLYYSSMKTKIMSSIMEEANINEESRTKIMLKLHKKHRSPRSKILESYLHDKSKDEDSASQERNAQAKDDVKKRLMPDNPKDSTSPTFSPKKEKWSRRRSYPKKHRHLFELDDEAAINESCSSMASELSQRLSMKEETSFQTRVTSDSSNYANESRVSNDSSKIEELLETLESSNENSVDNKMETITIQNSPLSTEDTPIENIVEKRCDSPPQQADTSNEEQNTEIVEICEKIRKAQKEHMSEDESFPFNVISPCEREEFSPIGNASRVLPDDAICSPRKKSKKRKKSRHKSSKSKRRRKHSGESEVECTLDSSTATKLLTENKHTTTKIDSSVVTEIANASSVVTEVIVDGSAVAESLIDGSAVAKSPIASSHVAETPNDCSSVAERSVDSLAVAERPTDGSVMTETLVERPSVAKTLVEHSSMANILVERLSVADSLVEDSFVPETFVEQLSVAEPLIVHSSVAEALIDHSSVAEPLIDHSSVAEPLSDDSTVAGTVVDHSSVEETIVDLSSVAETVVDHTSVTDTLVDDLSVTLVDHSFVIEGTVDGSAVAEGPPIGGPAVVDNTYNSSAEAEIALETSALDTSAVADNSLDISTVADNSVDSSAVVSSSIDNSAFVYSPIDNPGMAESSVEEPAYTARSSIDFSAISESSFVGGRPRDKSAAAESSVDHLPVTESSGDHPAVIESPCSVLPQRYFSHSAANKSSVKCSIDLSVVANASIDYLVMSERFSENSAAVDSPVDRSVITESPNYKAKVTDTSVDPPVMPESFQKSSDNGFVDTAALDDRAAVAETPVNEATVADTPVNEATVADTCDPSVTQERSHESPDDGSIDTLAPDNGPAEEGHVSQATAADTFVDSSADSYIDTSFPDGSNRTLEEATVDEFPLVSEAIATEEIVLRDAPEYLQQKIHTDLSVIDPAQDQAGQDQVQEQEQVQKPIQNENELRYVEGVDDICDNVTEEAVLGEDHITEEVVTEELSQNVSSQESTSANVQPFFEQISNEGIFEDNDEEENLREENCTPFELFPGVNQMNDELVVSDEVVIEENLSKSADASLTEVDGYESTAIEPVEQKVSFAEESLVDVRNTAAEELLQDRQETVVTESLATSHEETEAVTCLREEEAEVPPRIWEDQIDEHSINLEVYQKTVEETIQDGVVTDFERDELSKVMEKKDELGNLEQRDLVIEEVDNDKEKKYEIRVEIARDIHEGEATKEINESGVTADNDESLVRKEKEETTRIDSNFENVNSLTKKDVFERDNECFTAVQLSLDSEIPSEVEVLHRDVPKVFNLPTEKEIEIDSYDRENDSFELIQSRPDNEVNLFEQEVVQEVNVETEEMMELAGNADEVGNTGDVSNGTVFIEEAPKGDGFTEQFSLVDSEMKKIDEALPDEALPDEAVPGEAVPGEANVDAANFDKCLEDNVFKQKLFGETRSVDTRNVETPTRFKHLVVDKLPGDGDIVEQDVESEANKLTEVVCEETTEALGKVAKADDNGEGIVVDAATRDIAKELVSTEEEYMNQGSYQIEPEKIVEEIVTDIVADNTFSQETSSEPGTELLESNKLEVKCVSDTEDEFKFSIQTNLSNLTSREEISAIALATLAEMKTNFENSDSNTSEDILPKVDLSFPEKLSEPELVAIEGTLTVVSEKDLADGQVEITSEKVISSKKPATLSSFSMDFSDSTNDSTSTSSDIISKFPDFDSKGTEFSSRAITKELKPKCDIKKANTYERYELLDILEGNSEIERRAEYHASKQPFDADMCDFEEHIPSQIVCSSKFKQDMDELKDEIKKKEKPHKSSIMSTTSKLLERLSESKSGESAFKMEVKPTETTVVATTKELASHAGTSLISKTFKPITLKTKSVMIPEQIVKPVAEAEKPKNMLNDIEDVEAFVIHKDIKKHLVEEEPEPDISTLRPARASRRKVGKANILQQTIITPEGEIIQPAVNTTAKKRGSKQIAIKSLTLKATAMNPPASKPAPVKPVVTVGISTMTPLPLKTHASTISMNPAAAKSAKPSAPFVATAGVTVGQDDNIFDINSMPIVLSDEILTPESIENMQIVIGSDAPSGKPAAQEKATPAKRPLPAKIVTTPAQTLLTTKTPSVSPKISRPRILQTVTSKPSKTFPLLPSTPKPGKYIIIPQGALPQGATATKLVTKKAVMKKSPVTSGPVGFVAKPPNLAPEPSGNKIMIVTNQQGQQQRLLLTPAQQKMLGYQTQGTKFTKAVMKSSVIPKGVPISKAATLVEAGTSKMPSLLGQKLIISSSSGQSLMATTSQVVAGATPPGKIIKSTPKQPVVQKKVGSSGKTPKTILITSKQGHTVKKITTTEDDIEKQVAEQLEAIKARSGMKLGPLPKPVTEPLGLTACKPVHKTPSRRSYSKKVEQKGKAGPVGGIVQQTVKSEALSTPPPLVVTTTSRKVPASLPGEMRKLLPEEPKPHPDRPLNQLVIQDAVGNQTTITEGQILALPSETVGGHPQSYMLVTLDETGNLTPLNNEALLSLDPNLGLGGDLSNMVLQIDQGALASGPQQTMPLAQPATVKLSNPGEALRAGTSKIDIPVDKAPVSIPVASTTLQETVIDPQIPQNVLSIPDTPVGMQPIVPSSNGEPGQQLIVTGDPIATQKFLESLTEGTTDLANIIASAEGKSILIQADGQQILINTNADNQMLLSVNNDVNSGENTEGGGNPIFATQPNKNTDILAAALADTDVFTAHPKMPTQLSPSTALYPMNVGNVLETITLNSPIMTPLEVASTNVKKISDETDILSQVPKNVDLPITITDPNIAQTVANQQVASLMPNELQSNLELSLPMSDSVVSVCLTSPGYTYSLPSLDESVDMTHKPFSSSMPLLNDDVEEPPQQPIQMSKKHPGERDRDPASKCAGDAINSGGSFLEEESRFTLGREMCSSLSEPPPEMFDIPEVNSYVEKHANHIPLSLHGVAPDLSDGLSKDGDTTDLSTQAESSNDGSCEIPLQPRIVARGSDASFDSIRRLDGKL